MHGYPHVHQITPSAMSESAQALMHYAGNALIGCADDSDRGYCLSRAREWAAYIIGAGC